MISSKMKPSSYSIYMKNMPLFFVIFYVFSYTTTKLVFNDDFKGQNYGFKTVILGNDIKRCTLFMTVQKLSLNVYL